MCMGKPKYVEKECKHHGLTTYVLEGRNAYRCKQCRKEHVAEQRRRNKQRLIEEFGGKCSICGYDKYQGALHFHHLNPSQKSFGLGLRGITKGYDKLREEAQKCILVCANCHAEIHSGVGDR